jgi:AcrR family transcriptional regulator
MCKPEGSVGRPRSEQARAAILHAVDDLVLEIGYGAVTMKGIAERAGVSRQTVYRWWSTKAEILLEACVIDAYQELHVPETHDPERDVAAYLDALVAFLSESPAGLSYRVLFGEAQHDAELRAMLRDRDVVVESAVAVIARAIPPSDIPPSLRQAASQLVGPPFFWILSGQNPDQLDRPAILKGFWQLVRT